MRLLNTLLFWCALTGSALADDRSSSDPAMIVVLVLGLLAIIGGMGNIKDLRRKHMMPPRPKRRSSPLS